eukprot:m.230951 g.230951  ORF g.230951 m.230951 type:complete len:274 (+) comp40063_c0_seq22:6001-6822(+)
MMMKRQPSLKTFKLRDMKYNRLANKFIEFHTVSLLSLLGFDGQHHSKLDRICCFDKQIDELKRALSIMRIDMHWEMFLSALLDVSESTIANYMGKSISIDEKCFGGLTHLMQGKGGGATFDHFLEVFKNVQQDIIECISCVFPGSILASSLGDILELDCEGSSHHFPKKKSSQTFPFAGQSEMLPYSSRATFSLMTSEQTVKVLPLESGDPISGRKCVRVQRGGIHAYAFCAPDHLKRIALLHLKDDTSLETKQAREFLIKRICHAIFNWLYV